MHIVASDIENHLLFEELENIYFKCRVDFHVNYGTVFSNEVQSFCLEFVEAMVILMTLRG